MKKLIPILPKDQLDSVSPDQLISLKKSVERFFYKSQENIHLLEALKNEKAREFRKQFKEKLKKQIVDFAEIDRINEFLIATKKSEDGLIQTMVKLGLPLLAEDFIYDFLVWGGQQGGQAGLDKLNLNKEYIITENILGKLRDRSRFAVEVFNQTTEKWLAGIITTGIENNLKSIDIIKLIKSEAEKYTDRRSSIIMETELATAMSTVELQVYKDNNVQKKSWVTASDERTCQACMSNEGVGSIFIDESFPSGVDCPPAHVSCRCFILPN